MNQNCTQIAPLKQTFADLEDPRMPTLNMRHEFYDIIVLSICGVIAGADDWISVARFGQDKIDWFSTFLALPNGIPSHDVFERVFRKLNSDIFETCFLKWTQTVAQIIPRVVAIDGKTLRRSHDNSNDQIAIHMVSAWSVENQLVLGQVKTDSKSNEITAIPQ